MKTVITTQGTQTVRDIAIKSIVDSARGLVENAAAWGVILTIEQVPFKPLAMGNYTTRVSVRPARGDTVYVEDAS